MGRLAGRPQAGDGQKGRGALRLGIRFVAPVHHHFSCQEHCVMNRLYDKSEKLLKKSHQQIRTLMTQKARAASSTQQRQ